MDKKQKTTTNEGSGSSHKLILIIDGDPVGGTLLAAAIREGTPYHTFSVENGHQALHFVQEVRPDLILLGAGLPNTRSGELSRQLHRKRKMEHVPILFLSLGLSPITLKLEEPPPMTNAQFSKLAKLFDKIELAFTSSAFSGL